MTTKEAIEALSLLRIFDAPALDEAVKMAVTALRAQVEPPTNGPLTVEELREMAKRCEGIYVARIDDIPVFRDQKYCAAVLDFSVAFGSNSIHIHAIYGDNLTMWEDEYGKSWLAYRRKPEEAERE